MWLHHGINWLPLASATVSATHQMCAMVPTSGAIVGYLIPCNEIKQQSNIFKLGLLVQRGFPTVPAPCHCICYQWKIIREYHSLAGNESKHRTANCSSGWACRPYKETRAFLQVFPIQINTLANASVHRHKRWAISVVHVWHYIQCKCMGKRTYLGANIYRFNLRFRWDF